MKTLIIPSGRTRTVPAKRLTPHGAAHLCDRLSPRVSADVDWHGVLHLRARAADVTSREEAAALRVALAVTDNVRWHPWVVSA